MEGFWKKYRKPSGARMIFSTTPKGLALLVREEHELPLTVVMGARLRYDFSFEVCLCGEIKAFSERNVIFANKIMSCSNA